MFKDLVQPFPDFDIDVSTISNVDLFEEILHCNRFCVKCADRNVMCNFCLYDDYQRRLYNEYSKRC